MRLKLEHWLALTFFGLTALFVGAISLGFYAQLREALLYRTQNQLLSINILKKQLVEQYLSSLTDSVSTTQVTSDLASIMTERTGMGTTGESYLVSADGRMLTGSRFFSDTLPKSIAVDTEGFRRAKMGKTGVAVYSDYRGVPIIGAYRPVEQVAGDWVLLTEIDEAEALRSIRALRNRFFALSLILLVISGAASIGLAIALARPINVLQRNIRTLTRGQIPSEQYPASRIREINDMILSLNELIRTRQQAVRFAQRIGYGDFTAAYPTASDGDQLSTALLSMRDQLVELSRQQAQLERDTKRLLVEGQEAERERIARDIHDSIGPLLTTAKLKLASANASEANEEVRHLLGEVITEVRRVSANLMPAVLRDFGPGEALNQLVRNIEANSDIKVRYVDDLRSESRLTKEIGVALYRIAQEAITNTLRHAQAGEIVMSLTEFDDQVTFYFRDNGVGFTEPLPTKHDGRGLQNIRERIRILNGTVRIYSEQNTSVQGTSVRGTVIEAEIPLV